MAGACVLRTLGAGEAEVTTSTINSEDYESVQGLFRNPILWPADVQCDPLATDMVRRANVYLAAGAGEVRRYGSPFLVRDYDEVRNEDGRSGKELITRREIADLGNVRSGMVRRLVAYLRMAMLAGREFLIQQGDLPSARIHRPESEVASLREELRIVAARMKRIDPHRRPQYLPAERMAILELRAMRGWSKAETARRFFVSDDTIRTWLRRAEDDSLLHTTTPVNRFPDVIRYVIQQIKLFCPTLGKVKIADKLARAGIHIGKTTVQRILKQKPGKEPESPSDDRGTGNRIVAKYPSHTWHADLTAVPISGGFWTNWVPHAIWQRWPVCWWLLNVVDHYSRRLIGFAVFKTKPSSEEVTAALARIMFQERIRPKHMIVDQAAEQTRKQTWQNWPRRPCTLRPTIRLFLYFMAIRTRR
jgi:transposase